MVFIFIFAYIVFGIWIVVGYVIFTEGYDLFSGYNKTDETNKMILIGTFWPIYCLYFVIKAIIWYVKHLIALKDFFNKHIKIK